MKNNVKKPDPGMARFIFSMPAWKEGEAPDLPMVVVCGRSNVGKSSFINMLLGRRGLARTSSTPGRTQLLNFFEIDGKIILVDVPGYGYAKAPPDEVRRWTERLKHFIRSAGNIKLVIELLDIRREPSADDISFADLVRQAGRELRFAITKADKESKGRRAGRVKAIAAALGAGPRDMILTSAEERLGKREMWEVILERTGFGDGGTKSHALEVVAIDGPAGAGKSTVARAVAAALGWNYLDTGAMYRAVGLKADRLGIALDDHAELEKMCAGTSLEFGRDENGAPLIFLDGEDVTRAIRENRVSALASRVSASKPVRDAMSRFQREIGVAIPTVAEGRDMGTVVFPDARVKIFLTATAEKRAARRVLDLKSLGQEADYEKILAEIKGRDEADSTREHAPLKPAPDAVQVDTSDLGPEEVVQRIAELAAK